MATLTAEHREESPPPWEWFCGGLFGWPSTAYRQWHAERGLRITPLQERPGGSLREAVLIRDRGICGICSLVVGRDDKLHFDHIFPVSRGGKTTLDNLQVAHARCNLSKGAKVA